MVARACVSVYVYVWVSIGHTPATERNYMRKCARALHPAIRGFDRLA